MLGNISSRVWFPLIASGPLAASLALAACTTTTTEVIAPTGTADAAADAPAPVDPGPDLDLAPDLISARPYKSKAPAGDDGTTALPLVLALHGRGDNGPSFAKALGLLELVESKKILVAYPTGEAILGATGWAAISSLKDGPDDVKYLRAVIADMKARYNVDARRVVVVGLSLGGFMANFLGCTAADKITGILSISASIATEATTGCAPAQHLAVTMLHGTADSTIDYQGGMLPIINEAYLSAPELYDFWSSKMGCTSETNVPAADFDSAVTGNEATGQSKAGCEGGRPVTFFTLKDSAHVPELSAATVGILIDGVSTPRN